MIHELPYINDWMNTHESSIIRASINMAYQPKTELKIFRGEIISYDSMIVHHIDLEDEERLLELEYYTEWIDGEFYFILRVDLPRELEHMSTKLHLVTT